MPYLTTSRHRDVVTRAIADSDRGYSVVIIASNSFHASSIYWALVDNLSKRPWLYPPIFTGSNGRWGIAYEQPWRGRISVRVKGISLRGMSADLAYLDRRLLRSDTARRDAQLIVHNSPLYSVRTW